MGPAAALRFNFGKPEMSHRKAHQPEATLAHSRCSSSPCGSRARPCGLDPAACPHRPCAGSASSMPTSSQIAAAAEEIVILRFWTSRGRIRPSLSFPPHLGSAHAPAFPSRRALYPLRGNEWIWQIADENDVGEAEARHFGFALATARGVRRLRYHIGVSLETCRGGAMIVLKILATWTVVSMVTGLAIAPALSRRLRGIKFSREDE
jgi:hypothetical protein